MSKLSPELQAITFMAGLNDSWVKFYTLSASRQKLVLALQAAKLVKIEADDCVYVSEKGHKMLDSVTAHVQGMQS